MRKNDWLEGSPSARSKEPGATAAVPAAKAETAEPSVCYCGHYENCPHWDEMTDDERRACSTDKRMAVESLWKAGVRGA